MGIEWQMSLDEAVGQAQKARRFVLGYFSKDPCPNCEALNQHTFTDDAVQRFMDEHFIPAKVLLDDREERQQFRVYRVVWTPTVVLMDWRGRDHYQSPGYLAPEPFLSMLRVGLGRSLMPWSRYDEAAELLETVAQQPHDLFAPEALYWLGMARYIGKRSQSGLDEAWGRLRANYPDSVWAARVPPER